MNDSQFTIIKTFLEEIRDAIKEQQSNQQPVTKITVVGNKPQPNLKGLNTTEVFEF
jgi:hypothetical protein